MRGFGKPSLHHTRILNTKQEPGQKHALKQKRSLKLTPEMRQAISLLELSHEDLQHHIEAEVEKNLFLSLSPPTPPLTDKSNIESPDLALSSAPSRLAISQIQTSGVVKDSQTIPRHDPSFFYKTAYISHRPKAELSPNSAIITGVESRKTHIEPSSLNGPVEWECRRDLHGHIRDQIALDFSTKQDMALALELLDHLDDAGYLRCDMQEFTRRKGIAADKTARILKKLQGLDPPGIFARSLSECLALQLRDKDELDAPMQRLLDNLHLVESTDRAKLCKLCTIDRDTLENRLSLIRTLDPKPGAGFSNTVAQTRVADILLKKTEVAGWYLELNPEALPRVFVDQTYFETVSLASAKPEESLFLSRQLKQANWLCKSINQRCETLIKTTQEIFIRQSGFLDKGVAGLRPLTMGKVGETIGVHESTISRIVRGKYVTTPFGLFELRFFFSPGLSHNNQAQESLSVHYLRHRIKTLVESENGGKILSDGDIAHILRGEGIAIARRTVAKYRSLLKIAGSPTRKKQARLEKL